MKHQNFEARLASYLSLTLAGVIALLPFHAFLTTWLGSNIGQLDLARIWKEIILALLLAPTLWLAAKTDSLSQWLRRSPLLWLINGYIALHLLLAWFALSAHRVNATAVIYSLIINLRFLIIFAIAYILASKSDLLRQYWLKLLLLPASLVIAFGLVQRFLLPYDFLKHFGYGPKTIPAYQTVDNNLSYRRIQSTLRGANPLGAYFLLIVPAWLALKRRPYKTIGLILSVPVIFFTYSRSAWVGLLAALISLAMLQPRGSRRLKGLVLAGTLVIFLAAAGLLALTNNQAVDDTLLHTSSASTNVSSNTRRATAIKQAATEVIQQPLGQGPGTAGPASFRNSGHPARIAENYYLQIAQEVGLAGLALFLAINWLVLVQLWQKREQVLSRLLLASWLGITFVNLVSHAWTDDTLSLLWWGLAGIACAPVIIRGRLKENGKAQKKTA